MLARDAKMARMAKSKNEVFIVMLFLGNSNYTVLGIVTML